MDAIAMLLATALTHRISVPNIDAGFEQFSMLTAKSVDYETFCDAVASCLRQGLIREPVRLPEGSLQCHWHLELTPDGVDAARHSALTPNQGH